MDYNYICIKFNMLVYKWKHKDQNLLILSE